MFKVSHLAGFGAGVVGTLVVDKLLLESGDFLLLEDGASKLALDTGSVDPLFSDVVLLTPFDGTDGDIVTSDLSNSAHSPSTFSGNAQLDDSQKKFGNTSLLLDGNSDMVTFPDHADWILGTGPFCAEAHIRLNSIGTSLDMIMGQFGQSASFQGWGLFVNNTTLWFYYHDGTLRNFNQAFIPLTDRWYHVCVERDDASDTRLFVDGNPLGSSTNITNNIRNVTTAFSFGWRPSGSPGANDLDGWIGSARLTKAERYAGAFTPPDNPFPRA